MSSRWRGILVLGFVVLLAAAIGACLAGGVARCGEFSPDSLKTRAWSERRLALTDVRIWRGEEVEYQWPVVRFLVAEGFWRPVETERPMWLETSSESSGARDGISHLAMELGGHGEDWVKWSNAHPELARHFWRRLLERLRKGDQRGVHEAGVMFLAARYSGSVEEFERMMAE